MSSSGKILFALITAAAFLAPLCGQETEPAARATSHWAFRPLQKPTVPRPADPARVRTAVDAFILSRLEAKHLTLAADAAPLMLLRRIYLDLWGLPPSPADVDAYLQDQKPGAYERVVDRLLASPRFGERWARHWLDEAGYADVTGSDNDAKIIILSENRWRYRDYVIQAYNNDKPFDRFLLEQLAGDELVDWRSANSFTPEIKECLIATGFLRLAPDTTDERELNTLDIRYDVLHRTVETVASNLLGLTLHCCRCHDHKFEPISHKDYYRFEALFQPAYNPQKWLQPKDRPVTDTKEDKSKDKSTSDKKEDKSAKKPDPNLIQALYDTGLPTPTYLLKRGNHEKPGAEVAPGFLSVLCPSEKETALPVVKAAGTSSGRRLALAHWLRQPNTPANSLLLRVRVNRVWQHLFGKGLVESSDNFGVTGAKPSHPQLLDWLAAEYAAGGQKLKPLIKLLVTSSVYRQTSMGRGTNESPDPRKIDPDNQLLWRMRLRRLEAEAIRDSLLTASGRLDDTMYGPPIPVEPRADGFFVVKDTGLPTPTSQWRRSIYLLARRNYHPTFLNVFDMPTLTGNCTRRASSAVVLQTLTMLNDAFILEQASMTAQRISAAMKPGESATGDSRRYIETAFRLILGRSPTGREMELAGDLLVRQARNHQDEKAPLPEAEARALANLCHMLLNSSEFLYVP